jgi:hypothetical protein
VGLFSKNISQPWSNYDTFKTFSTCFPADRECTKCHCASCPLEKCHPISAPKQGCQMVCFQTKNHNLGKFWSALDWKMLKYFMAIWNILMRFGNFYCYLVHFLPIWYIFPGFGIMYQEKSGNPAPHRMCGLFARAILAR